MRNINLIYPFVILALVISHVFTLVAPRIFTWFDLIIVIYFMIYERLDEKNFIWLSLIFGLFSDYLRGGFFGPAVMLFLLFSFSRFKVDLVLDMTKLNSKMLLYVSASFIYSLFNAVMAGYSFEIVSEMVAVRTVLDILATFCIIKLTGYIIAFKNA